MKPQKSKKRRIKVKPKFINLPKRPPVSKRYCVGCKCIRTFKYNRTVGHSACTVCGGRESRRPKTKNI